ncbi:MAG: DEAD/DEAH box helicase, partial [Flavobacteriaceae bacterium]|nr:DEAD/DEAH box helicase [Flavobacteriaceae bacterium]
MLPLQNAFEVKQSIIEYLRTTYHIRDPKVKKAFMDFISNPTNGIFKGPYISLKLPFQKGNENQKIPLNIKPNFKPYRHQLESFNRLHTQKGHKPKSTLLTTGTGSGKTECFLYPILDYCNKTKGQSGIKVIILYPMNALATDQAKRLAQVIDENPELKGEITAGLFIGVGRNKEKYPDKMGPNHIIENRDEILQNPPDILLTNFKMLDYGLLRSQYHSLWQYNLKRPELLQFLILDELHTYDGAQGTDVANLIRRLKLKLNVPVNQLCPIGTSATIGKGKDLEKQLIRYASDVFGEEFTPESIISEKRLTSNDFFSDATSVNDFIPSTKGIEDCQIQETESYHSYIERQKQVWHIPERCSQIELGTHLKSLQIIKDMTIATKSSTLGIQELIDRISSVNTSFNALTNNESFSPKRELIKSLLALIAEAKSDDKSSPLLFLQVHLWIRELSGFLRLFDSKPKFLWQEEKRSLDQPMALPAYYCRSCGASGWLGVKKDSKEQFEKISPSEVYDKFFNNHEDVFFVNISKNEHQCADDYKSENIIEQKVNQTNLKFETSENEKTLLVLGYRQLIKNNQKLNSRSKNVCPECNSNNTIGVIGGRTSLLHSIAVNQLLSSELDQKNLQKRKILSFTNGVQDAAHIAGYVGARSFRFLYRASIQKVITEIENPIDLKTFASKFIEHWKQNSDPTEQNNKESYYHRFFPSDYIGKADVDDFKSINSNKLSKDFRKEFDLRVQWEIFSEFGFNAVIGRTLEKTMCSAIGFESKLFESTYQNLKPWLDKNSLCDIEKKKFDRLLLGLLHRMRIRGGIDHPYLKKFREEKSTIWSLNWMKDGRHFLNKHYGKRDRIPKLVCTQEYRGTFDSTFTGKVNWFHNYFKKNFPSLNPHKNIINEFYNELFIVLSKCDTVNHSENSKLRNYAMNPSILILSKKVTNYRCEKCNSELQVYNHKNQFNQIKCLRYRCTGTYNAYNGTSSSYYKMVYNRSSLSRIYSSEHTGLLDRTNRAIIEIDFRERPKFNSKNVLVATSTLEMGIDIGTLDNVINTSIPPLPSNFLQRIGRAGRSSGAALILNFCHRKDHDLFFFEDPLEMMESEVNTPGCFLNAKYILQRHFNAFCIDSWSKHNPEKARIPFLIKELNLLNKKPEGKIDFIEDLFHFIKINKTQLLHYFIGIYEDKVEPIRIDEIKRYVKENDIQKSFEGVFINIINELKFSIIKIKESKNEIETKSLSIVDPDRIELEKGIAYWKKIQRAINKQQVLKVLTNQGVLPNYAFPETGVSLKAQIYGDKPKGGEKAFDRKSIEVIRPANQAIRELAPNNHFYSHGHKLLINGLNVSDWGKSNSKNVAFRYCSNCDFLMENEKATLNGCPKCGHPSWNANSNVKKMVLLDSVLSNCNRREASINDTSEAREREIFLLSNHFDFDVKKGNGAYINKNKNFGIEFVNDVKLTNVNLGLKKPLGETVKFNNHNASKQGFRTCKSCGKSTPYDGHHLNESDLHHPYCQRRKSIVDDHEDVFEDVYLYRTLETEALKILIPQEEISTEEQQSMFKSGIFLGLKKLFKGNPSHIQMEFYLEFNNSTTEFDKYLVLYDTIPGGTGYLQKIYTIDNFNTLISSAYQVIKECSCKTDGCYKCILFFSNQFERTGFSRQKAEDMFYSLVETSKEWKKVDFSLSSLKNPKVAEESELEFKFRNALKEYVKRHQDKGFEFESFDINNKRGFLLTIPNNEYQIRYAVEPQVQLEKSDGISHFTRSDYLFRCEEVTINGQSVNGEEHMKFKNVAIYIDGYQYHASSEHLRFYDDIEIRKGINQSSQFYQWSITNQDIVLFEKDKSDELFLDEQIFGHTKSKIDQIE